MNPNRWKPGGDKYESIKADEQWEKAHIDDGSNEVCRACGYINKECKCGHEGDEPNW